MVTIANLRVNAEALMEQGSEYCYALQEMNPAGVFHCFICDGTGVVPDDSRVPDHDKFMIGQTCPVCMGFGMSPLKDQEEWGYRRWGFHNFWP